MTSSGSGDGGQTRCVLQCNAHGIRCGDKRRAEHCQWQPRGEAKMGSLNLGSPAAGVGAELPPAAVVLEFI